MESFNAFLSAANAILWHEYVLYALVVTGVIFTIWSRFSQFTSITHGVAVVRGKYHDAKDPGAISHFQALSAALSATVGLGNIGGVALAVALGGPGAIFWIWIIGFIGMSIKLTEVTLSMLYRNTDDSDNPHGGPMWVVSKGIARLHPNLAWLGRIIGVVFCLTLLVSATTGGNMFQSWNVAELTHTYFGVPGPVTGIVLAVIVGSVIIGGIKRIGRVAGTLVPFMVAMYLLAGIYVLAINITQIPGLLVLIVSSAFNPTEASGAFMGGTAASAFLLGMKRALFSNEAGQGSSPIAHSAAKTDEPVREGIVAGLEPFIDTIVVCTFTALVILSTGVWQRGAEATFANMPAVIPADAGQWTLADTQAPPRQAGDWNTGLQVFMIVEGDEDVGRGNSLHRISGEIAVNDAGTAVISWSSLASESRPVMKDTGLYVGYAGAALTARAFDTVADGLGMWLVTIAAWLFAISTIISWSYYGEQGIVYLAGDKAVLPYKLVYLMLTVVAALGLIRTDTELDNLTGLGTGVMLFANVPIMWFFGYQAMRAYRNYKDRLKSGQLDDGSPAPTPDELLKL